MSTTADIHVYDLPYEDIAYLWEELAKLKMTLPKCTIRFEIQGYVEREKPPSVSVGTPKED